MTLSDKIGHCKWFPNCNKKCVEIDIDDVKEFIRELKKEVNEINTRDKSFRVPLGYVLYSLDKLAGEELCQ